MNILKAVDVVNFLNFKKIARIFLCLIIPGAALLACASQMGSSVTIAEATAAHDGSQVVVTGDIVQQMDNEHLLLRDGSGQITIKVEKEILGKVKFAPDSHLRVYGTMDRNSERSILIAKSVQVVK